MLCSLRIPKIESVPKFAQLCHPPGIPVEGDPSMAFGGMGALEFGRRLCTASAEWTLEIPVCLAPQIKRFWQIWDHDLNEAHNAALKVLIAPPRVKAIEAAICAVNTRRCIIKYRLPCPQTRSQGSPTNRVFLQRKIDKDQRDLKKINLKDMRQVLTHITDTHLPIFHM